MNLNLWKEPEVWALMSWVVSLSSIIVYVLFILPAVIAWVFDWKYKVWVGLPALFWSYMLYVSIKNFRWQNKNITWDYRLTGFNKLLGTEYFKVKEVVK